MFSTLFSSLRVKIFLPLLLIFVAILGATLYLAEESQRDLGETLIEQQVQTAADFYLDSLNIMMINDEMDERRIVQTKMLAQPGMVEARIIRSELINEEYGDGADDQAPIDELDHEGLAGIGSLRVHQMDGRQVMTVIRPIPLLEVYRDTRCMECHEEGKKGDILGTVRISYDMETLNTQVNKNLLTNAAVLLSVFAIGIFALIQIQSRAVNRPIKRLIEDIGSIQRDADLRQRVDVRSRDEFGTVARTFNNMLEHFQGIMQEVAGTTHTLSSTTTELSCIAENTKDSARQQNKGTEKIAMAIAEMDASSHQVRDNAKHSSKLSLAANELADSAVNGSALVIEHINALSGEVSSVSEVIDTLNDKTRAVSSVLDVIKGISEQTNLLALNAAIEAARAGDAGRGFAVVASEVRLLSQRTNESTHEIEQTIADLQSESSSAVQAILGAQTQAQSSVDEVKRTVNFLHEIAQHIGHISDYNVQVASSAQDQSSCVEGINRSICAIRDTSDESLRSAEGVSTASHSLEELNLQLERAVDNFKV